MGFDRTNLPPRRDRDARAEVRALDRVTKDRTTLLDWLDVHSGGVEDLAKRIDSLKRSMDERVVRDVVKIELRVRGMLGDTSSTPSEPPRVIVLVPPLEVLRPGSPPFQMQEGDAERWRDAQERKQLEEEEAALAKEHEDLERRRRDLAERRAKTGVVVEIPRAPVDVEAKPEDPEAGHEGATGDEGKGGS